MAKYPGGTLTPLHGSASEFGKYYAGSSKYKQNNRKRKKLAKSNSK